MSELTKVLSNDFTCSAALSRTQHNSWLVSQQPTKSLASNLKGFSVSASSQLRTQLVSQLPDKSLGTSLSDHEPPTYM